MKTILNLLLVAVLATSCAAIPTAGPIQIIENYDSATDFDDVRVIAKSPTSRMSATQIAAGFVAANISTFGDFSVAREYLTYSASGSWFPTSFDVLDSASIQYNDLGTGVVEISAIQIGKLKANHRFEVFATPKPFLLQLKMQSGRSGLRIASSIPNGILASADLLRGFSPYSIYFGNQNFSRLVPEVIWLPKNEKSIATKLVKTLLQGSKESLYTAIPSGTDLRFDSVTITNGSASINLNAVALSADNAQRKFMLAQLVWTVQNLPAVGRVQIASNDRIISTQGKTFFNQDNFADLNPRYSDQPRGLYEVKNNRLSLRTGSLSTFIGKLEGVTQFSISHNQKQIAYLANNQLQIAPLSNLKRYVVQYENVSQLAFDQQNRIWFTNQKGRLFCLFPDESVQEVLRLPTGKISGFAISPDSGRVALVVTNAGNSSLQVGSIIVENGNLQISSLRKVEQALTEVMAVDWINSLEMVVIGKVGLRESVTAQVALTFSSVENLNAPREFVSLSTSSDNSLVATTKSGSVWIYQSGIWNKLENNAQVAFSE